MNFREMYFSRQIVLQTYKKPILPEISDEENAPGNNDDQFTPRESAINQNNSKKWTKM